MNIKLQGVAKSYLEGKHRHLILKDININFDSGKFTTILGKSGSGKSTLLNLISGIDTPDKGNIFLDNNNLTRLSDHNRTLFRREKIGIIFQFFNLISTLTVLENITLISELGNRNTRQSRQKALDLLEKVGLADKQNVMPDVLSGGEQQRVAIARALAHDPEIILADEPTGNLDHKTANKVMELFLSLIREQGKTLIMATHSLDFAGLADKTFRIKDSILVGEAGE